MGGYSVWVCGGCEGACPAEEGLKEEAGGGGHGGGGGGSACVFVGFGF